MTRKLFFANRFLWFFFDKPVGEFVGGAGGAGRMDFVVAAARLLLLLLLSDAASTAWGGAGGPRRRRRRPRPPPALSEPHLARTKTSLERRKSLDDFMMMPA